MSQKHLPIVDQPASSLRSDGSRNYVHPADVSGRFTTRRNIVFGVLIAIYLALPFIRINGHPAVFLDVAHRRFYLFGGSFNSQDFWLAFFLLTGVGFSLIVMTSLFGRVWCGYACPHSVFLEGVFRRIERMIEGPRNERLKRNAAPMSFDKLWRKSLKHVLFLGLAAVLAHVFLSYFVSLPGMLDMVRHSPSRHMEAFLWTTGATVVMYFNFAWFREQLCLIICPYGRLQSTMTDSHTLVIGYDTTRGEPRGKASDPNAGACIDCKRCIQVCPTGIDIRNGLQLECVGCAACIDACDEVMDRLDRPRGLVRYDSMRGFEGVPTTFWRPRVFIYGALGLLGLTVATITMRSRTSFEAHLLRQAGAPFQLSGEVVTNPVNLHLVNKEAEPVHVSIRSRSDSAVTMETAITEFDLAPHESRYVPIMLRVPRPALRDVVKGRIEVVDRAQPDKPKLTEISIIGPASN